MSDYAQMPHVIITGTSRGLGLCLCSLYLSRGYSVTGFARSEVPDDLKRYLVSDQYKHIRADLADLKNVDLIISEFFSRRSQALIINAADYSMPDGFKPGEQIRQLDLNLVSPVMLISHILSRNYDYQPQVIYISSIMARIRDYRNPAYGAAKSAVSNFIDNSMKLSGGKVSMLNVIAGPMYMDDSAFPLIKKWTSVSYTTASAAILRKAGRRQTIFIPGIWRYIIWLGCVLGKKRWSEMINNFR